MNSPFLRTKHHIPALRPDLIARPRLTRRLEAGLAGKLILVSAPAGFGKTTLISNWIHQSQSADTRRKVGWLSLDGADNSPAGFWLAFISTLQTASTGIGAVACSALQSPQPPPIESTLASLINDVAAQAETLLVVLDDFHLIRAAEIQAGLDYLLAHLPDNLVVVVVTREDPAFPLARLRARGELTEIRAADLRFSPAESDELLNRVLSLDLPVADVAALVERSEGWITALRLAAISLQQEDDRHSFIQAFTASHRFLTDYLVDEVLSHQDAELRDFLLRTSILQRFSADLCDAVLEDTDSRARLRRLEQANLFLAPLDNDRCWYRYHHLFAEFLRLRLQETQADAIPALYQRAIDWCRAHSFEREALAYALAARQYPQAAELIERLSVATLGQEGAETVAQWIAALPEDLLRARPFLCAQYAWTLAVSGKKEAAESYLNTAETVCQELQPGEQRARIEGYIAAVRAYLEFFQGRHAAVVRLARQALAALPDEDPYVRARTAAFLGNGLLYAGELPAAQQAFASAQAVARQTGNIHLAALYAISVAGLEKEQGQLRQAFFAYRQAIDEIEQRLGRTDAPSAGYPCVGIGALQREWNELDRAGENIQRGIELCRARGQIDLLAMGLMEQAFLHSDRGEFVLARRALAEARALVQEFSPQWGLATVDSIQARVHLTEANLAAASRWADGQQLSLEDELDYVRSPEYQAYWRTLIATGQADQALRWLERLDPLYRPPGRVGRVVEVLIWKARALTDVGNRAAAQAALQEALALAQPGNYVRSFVEAGPALAALLRMLPASPYRNTLLAAFARHDPPPASLAEPLNEREIEILRRMAAGASNGEIGAELYLSVNTIRWYASQIYAKLGVENRKAAVALARQHGLI